MGQVHVHVHVYTCTGKKRASVIIMLRDTPGYVHKLPEVQHQPQETNKKHAAAALTTAVGENGAIAHQTRQPALGQSGIVDEPCRSRQVLQLVRAAGRKTVTA